MSATDIFTRLVRECWRFPGRLLVLLASLMSLGAVQLYLTWIIKLWAEGIMGHAEGAALRVLMQRAALLTGGAVLAIFVSRYLLNSLNQRLVERLRNAVHEHLLVMEVSAVRRLQSGEWMSRVFNDAGALSGFVRDVLNRLVGEGLLLIGAITMMFYLQWRLALAVCLLVPLAGLLLHNLGLRIRQRGTAAQQAVGRLAATLTEQLFGLTTIKGFQAEAFEHTRFARLNSRYRRQVMGSEWWTALLSSSIWLITGLGLLGIAWYGTAQTLSGRLTAGGLLAFFLYAVQTVEPLRRLSEVQSLLQRALAAAARVYEVIDAPAVEASGATGLPEPVRGELRFEQVTFRYRPDEPVLEGIDLCIAPGETVAVVAASGGGKSTLANLVERFVTPLDGRLLLDGIDVRELRLADVRRAVCVVEQTPFIFSGPLLDNLRYGAWHADRERIDAAVALAGLAPLVSALPGGTDALLEEAGRDLSGGQKQRIALARAIVRDPAVLVLDEATSALDSDSEERILAQLEGWLQRRTVLVMAHRLATISRFRRVVVLEGGRVVGDGSVDDLLRTCSAFSRLFAGQLAPLGASQPGAQVA